MVKSKKTELARKINLPITHHANTYVLALSHFPNLHRDRDLHILKASIIDSILYICKHSLELQTEWIWQILEYLDGQCFCKATLFFSGEKRSKLFFLHSTSLLNYQRVAVLGEESQWQKLNNISSSLDAHSVRAGHLLFFPEKSCSCSWNSYVEGSSYSDVSIIVVVGFACLVMYLRLCSSCNSCLAYCKVRLTV